MTAIVCNPVPLESGDRLSRDEFHRRYSLRPDLKKAELVEGVVYVASPVRIEQHGEPHTLLAGWAFTYGVTHPEVRIATDTTVRFDERNEVQPDLFLFNPARADAIRDDGYFHGPPDLVVEVAASSAAYDLHAKKAVYEQFGVPEYVVWDVEGGRVLWFVLESGAYSELTPAKNGIFESRQFPGLRLDTKALLEGDRKKLVAAIR